MNKGGTLFGETGCGAIKKYLFLALGCSLSTCLIWSYAGDDRGINSNALSEMSGKAVAASRYKPPANRSTDGAMKDNKDRIIEAEISLERLAKRDAFAAAVEFINLNDQAIKEAVQDVIAVEMANLDPASALSWIEANVSGPSKFSMLNTALEYIIQINPEAALGYVETFPPQQRDAAIMDDIATTWAMNDPEAAGQYIDNVPANARASWITSVASSYAASDPYAALNWLEQHSDKKGYSIALNDTLSIWATSDPLAVLDYVDEQPPGNHGLSSAVEQSIWSLAEHDSKHAVASVEAMQNGEVKDEAVKALASSWAENDTQGLQDWAATLDHGASRDSVIEALAMRVSDDPAYAVTLINTVDSGTVRVRSSIELLQEYKNNSRIARDITNQIVLSTKEREEIEQWLTFR